MALADFTDWLSEFSGPQYVWYVKRLSGNDTLANGSHQAGPYMPKDFVFRMFPELNDPEQENPRIWFDLKIDSHDDELRKVSVIWYNNKFRDGTRNEVRATNFGGISSALLDPENTGSLSVFVFVADEDFHVSKCHVWVCRNEFEEEILQDIVGPIEPGRWEVWSLRDAHYSGQSEDQATPDTCYLDDIEIPEPWRSQFPSGMEIVKKTLQLRPRRDDILVDNLLIDRRNCEYQIFLSLEEALELPTIRLGFNSIDEFVASAQSILQRRKSRSGRSLELHTREIFLEEGFHEEIHFSHQPESDPGKKPDFLFPSGDAYKNIEFPVESLRMLAVKTTCKDRWRQILNEAERIPIKHLLTLQEGVSENQFREMRESGVRLVVPKPLHGKYPESIRNELLTLENFITTVKQNHRT